MARFNITELQDGHFQIVIKDALGGYEKTIIAPTAEIAVLRAEKYVETYGIKLSVGKRGS